MIFMIVALAVMVSRLRVLWLAESALLSWLCLAALMAGLTWVFLAGASATESEKTRQIG